MVDVGFDVAGVAAGFGFGVSASAMRAEASRRVDSRLR
jgi:hypothetical protein